LNPLPGSGRAFQTDRATIRSQSRADPLVGERHMTKNGVHWRASGDERLEVLVRENVRDISDTTVELVVAEGCLSFRAHCHLEA